MASIRNLINKAMERTKEIPQSNGPITAGPIGAEEVREAFQVLQKYKAGKTNLEKRIVENEEWYKMRHWEQIRPKDETNTNDPEPASAWLFNSLANKHADAMDNYPEPNILPREEGDKKDAEALSSILPVVLEHNEFEQTYNDAWWYKLKTGTAVYGVFWNPKLENGLGDIDIRQIDILNIFWEPGIKDIQKSRNVFHVELVDNDILIQQYPQLNGKLSGATIDIAKYKFDDSVDTSNKSAVIDWYYKQTINDGESIDEILHYCKFVNDTVLYASENDPAYARRGFYDHAQYPFEPDVLFPEEGTPCGFGYIDIMKDPQMYIDKLNQIIMRNAYISGNPRYFASDSAGINENELLDLKKPIIHFTGNLDDRNFRKFEIPPLSTFIVQHLEHKVEEIKETSGNRDFSQGGTTSGVTAASAIAALQEAGSKLSRDMNKNSYRTFQKICYICLELIRQFYDEQRTFRIEGQKGIEFIKYSNERIAPQKQGEAFGIDLGFRRPVFDIKVTPQRANPFAKVAQNELAKELYGMGAFNPQFVDQTLIMLDMMHFDGKDEVITKISQNGTLMQMVQQMQAQMMKMAQIIDMQNGSQLTQSIMNGNQGAMQGQMIPGQQNEGVVTTNPLGKAVQTSESNTATKAQERAVNISNPQKA